MKWLLITFGVIVILGAIAGAIFYFSNLSNSCKMEDVQLTPAPFDLAQKFAFEHVQKNNQPYNWTLAGYVPAYSVEGDLYYYVFIFVKEGFSLGTLDKLTENALGAKSDDEKYQFSNVATVIVGAVKEDKLLFRHYRGVPEFVIEKNTIKEFIDNNYRGKTNGNLVLDAQGTVAYYSLSSDSDSIIRVPDKKVVSVRSLIESKEANEERRFSSYSKKECDSYKRAVEEARQIHIAEWDSLK